MPTAGPDTGADRPTPEPFPTRILALLLDAANRSKRGLLQEDAAEALRWIEARQEELRRQLRWRTYFVCARDGFLILRQVVIDGEDDDQSSIFELYGQDGTRVYSSNFKNAAMEVLEAEIKRVEAEAKYHRGLRLPGP